MKIRCDVCERAEAAVVCCADEAALCWSCDEKVHAANKVARKHQRVPLLPRGWSSSSSNSSHPSSSSSPSSEIPACDICQEKGGYLFCLEDRALLCRQCDLATHTTSPYVSSHQRFLITGVKVALEECRLAGDSGRNKNNNSSSSSNCCNSKNPLSSLASTNSVMSENPEGDQVGYAVENMESMRPQWPWNEFFDGVEFEQCYGLSKPGSSN